MYMTWLDGQGYKRFGTRGLLGTDALSNIIAATTVLILLGYRGLRKAAIKIPTEGLSVE